MPDRSSEVYDFMVRRGYPENFAALISMEMNTEFTARRIMGYIRGAGDPSLEEIADEMLAIKSDRDRIRDKHISEHAQDAINKWYNRDRED